MAHRVVLVDDAQDIADSLAFALRDYGYVVVPVGYTHDLGALVQRYQAVAVILGCSTVEMNESLFDVLRDDPDLAELPVVIIEVEVDAAVAALRAREARHVLIVPKPFRASQVATALEQLREPADSEVETPDEGPAV